MNTENLHQRRVYKVKYYSPTNTKGSRIKLTNLNTLESTFYSYDYRFNNIIDMAKDIIENKLTYLKVKETFNDKENYYLIANNL